MIGFILIVQFLAGGINAQFGHGFFVGVVLTLVLAYFANRVENRH
jgi:hypothetical protein